jgi:RNA polymerase sigma-70 factor (ECF subfamily)
MSDSIEARPFPVTPWTLVARAGEDSSAAARDALTQLLKRYVPALRAHLVLHRRIARDRADDLLQGFVSQKVLEQRLLSRSDPARGRFRSFILKAMDHYVIDELRKQRVREAMLAPTGAADDEPTIDDLADPGSVDEEPSQAFDVAWAREVIAAGVRQMREQCEQSGRDDLWGVFEARVLRPALEGTEPMPYERLIARFGFRSPAQASNALMTAKRMFARVLRGVIAEYADEPDEIEQEMNDIRAILAGG